MLFGIMVKNWVFSQVDYYDRPLSENCCDFRKLPDYSCIFYDYASIVQQIKDPGTKLPDNFNGSHSNYQIIHVYSGNRQSGNACTPHLGP